MFSYILTLNPNAFIYEAHIYIYSSLVGNKIAGKWKIVILGVPYIIIILNDDNLKYKVDRSR